MTTDSGRYLVKFGGNALGGPEGLRRLAADLKAMLADGASIVLVHGGGPAISLAMEDKGLKARKVSGIRVTDDAALAVAEEVLQGINQEVVDALQEAGIDALGLAGHSDGLVRCVRMAPLPEEQEDGSVEMVDLINVGEVDSVDAEALEQMLRDGILPVIYPIGATYEGERVNVNADTIACAVAAALACDEMMLVTDVPGILLDVKDPSSLLAEASREEVEEMIRDGIIRDGMIPKVQGCLEALEAGVRSTRMVNGRDPVSILGDLRGGSRKGTRVYMR